jgi:YVTN family beta-propeller protein
MTALNRNIVRAPSAPMPSLQERVTRRRRPQWYSHQDRPPALNLTLACPEAGQFSLAGLEHPVTAYLNGLAPSSRRPQLAALEAIARRSTQVFGAETMPWQLLRRPHVLKIRSLLEENYLPATANRMHSALRGVLKERWHSGQLGMEEYRLAVDVDPVRGESEPRARDLSASELRGLLEACARGLRNEAPPGLGDFCLGDMQECGRKAGIRPPAPTTCAGPGPAICSKPGSTWPRYRSWRGMPRFRLRAGLVANRDDGSIARINPKTNRVTQTIPVGHGPVSMVSTGLCISCDDHSKL